MGARRKGRELALQAAYLLELKGSTPSKVEQIIRQMPIADEEDFARPGEGPRGRGKPLSPEDLEKARDFAALLVLGTWEHLGEIDPLIAGLAEHWNPERMPVVDRNILRLAGFEIIFAEDIPPKATINEWIEVAKKYSTESSGAFVNGILDRLSREKAPAKARQGLRERAPRRESSAAVPPPEAGGGERGGVRVTVVKTRGGRGGPGKAGRGGGRRPGPGARPRPGKGSRRGKRS